ncbi:MAG: hypothetical protein HDT20_00165 [Oscillibacter sp.]|nr:hypothetical protein [Oscillibacter sp.]
MEIRCIWEHNGKDTLLYAENFPGAYTRGKTKEEALEKMAAEVTSYLVWAGQEAPDILTPKIIQEKESNLQICDADTDVLFDSEALPLSYDEYLSLKRLALKSASDFLALYQSIPDKDAACQPVRDTFYGSVPRTAAEMYEHTKNVNDYYFSEIGIETTNSGTILSCREHGFKQLEGSENYLNRPAVCGSYDEMWSLRKVLRRFIWHDRIHAKAMYRMAVKIFGQSSIENIFRFSI